MIEILVYSNICHKPNLRDQNLVYLPGIYTVKQFSQNFWICLDQTFLGLGLGKSFPARESLVSDIPAGDGNPLNLFFTVYVCMH